MIKKLVSILHPFTAEAVGLDEKNFHTFHSQPHFKALQMLMADKDFDVTIEYFTSKRKGYTKIIDGILYRYYPVSRKWNGDHRKWKKQSSGSCLRKYRQETPDVTIINMSGHSSPFSYELSLIIKSQNKDFIALLGGQHYSDNERNRNYYKTAHHILVHTKSQRREMLQMELFKTRDIRVFPLGVDTSVFKPIEKQNKIPTLLYVGRIVEWKRIHLGIRAIKQLKDRVNPESHLKIIGPISSRPYFLSLQKMIQDLELEKNITFIGPIHHHFLPSYFQEADLFILPSFKETFGMVMIEAMACGTPVVGMNFAGGPLEVITNGYDGIISTPEDYSKDIVDYFQSPTSIQKLTVNARKKVLKEYGISSTYAVLQESVSSILDN